MDFNIDCSRTVGVRKVKDMNQEDGLVVVVVVANTRLRFASGVSLPLTSLYSKCALLQQYQAGLNISSINTTGRGVLVQFV